MNFFNVRTYGVLINQNQEILISDEIYKGQVFSKFPGGGLELGESLPEAIKREFIEECNLIIENIQLLHITDNVVVSIFNDSQVLGVYYQVFTNAEFCFPIKTKVFDFDEGSNQSFRWVSLSEFSEKDLTFKMDQEAWKDIKKKILI